MLVEKMGKKLTTINIGRTPKEDNIDARHMATSTIWDLLELTLKFY